MLTSGQRHKGQLFGNQIYRHKNFYICGFLLYSNPMKSGPLTSKSFDNNQRLSRHQWTTFDVTHALHPTHQSPNDIRQWSDLDFNKWYSISLARCNPIIYVYRSSNPDATVPFNTADKKSIENQWASFNYVGKEIDRLYRIWWWRWCKRNRQIKCEPSTKFDNSHVNWFLKHENLSQIELIQ